MTGAVSIDVCGLGPPEPLERILDTLESLPPGRHLLVTIDREPHPLFRILKQSGHTYTSRLTAAGLYEIRIEQPA